jgi:hypothetical protein
LQPQVVRNLLMRVVSPYLPLRIVYPSSQRGATRHRFAVVAVGMSRVINGRVARGRSTTRGAAAKHQAASRRFQRGTLAATALVLFAVSVALPAHAQQTSGGAGGDNSPSAGGSGGVSSATAPGGDGGVSGIGNSGGGGGGGAGSTGGSGGGPAAASPAMVQAARAVRAPAPAGIRETVAVAALVAAVVAAVRTARWSLPRRPIRRP